ncbi:MAG: cob(I)yrinic acid a,c-diamide adenosyltransferase [Chloroflexota bacterium]
MKTFNKRGDAGQTSLLYGGRVSKSDLRCEAYGTIDEAVSALGVARNFVTKAKTKGVILKVQKELFIVCAEIATRPEEYDKLTSNFTPVTTEMVDWLEATITDLEAEIEMPKVFIIPGGNAGSAFLDLARAMTRTAERNAVQLKEANEIKNELILKYLNRLADLLFTLARYEEAPLP